MRFNKKNKDYIVCVLNKDGTVYPVAWSENKPSKKRTRKECLPYKNDEHFQDAIYLQATRLYDNKRDYQKKLYQLD